MNTIINGRFLTYLGLVVDNEANNQKTIPLIEKHEGKNGIKTETPIGDHPFFKVCLPDFRVKCKLMIFNCNILEDAWELLGSLIFEPQVSTHKLIIS